MNYLLYADGACPGNGRNPEQSTGSFAVYEIGDARPSTELHEKLRRQEPLHHDCRFSIADYDTGRHTNNKAEAKALACGIAWCCENGILRQGNTLHVCMDSQLVLNQFSGLYRTKNQQLAKIYHSIYNMLKRHGKLMSTDVSKLIHLHWIPGTTMKASVIAH